MWASSSDGALYRKLRGWDPVVRWWCNLFGDTATQRHGGSWWCGGGRAPALVCGPGAPSRARWRWRRGIVDFAADVVVVRGTRGCARDTGTGRERLRARLADAGGLEHAPNQRPSAPVAAIEEPLLAIYQTFYFRDLSARDDDGHRRS